jgi:2-polyprenyl-3-methyl-5-hydroxy-6-metoxy-1,4-benzoquinol methylase
MSADEKRRGMEAFSWYHTVDLGDGVVTPGQYDHRQVLSSYGIPDDLTGKTALDVGPAHGYFAFELEQRGASVTTLELPDWKAHDASPALKRTFDETHADEAAESWLHGALRFAAEARGSRIEQRYGTVYDLDPNDGTFDLVFCASLLLHLTDPLAALYAVRRVCDDQAIVATAIDTSRTPKGVPYARFVGRVDGQTFWMPNLACLEQWALAAGFARVERVSEFRLRSLDRAFDAPNGVIRASVR